MRINTFLFQAAIVSSLVIVERVCPEGSVFRLGRRVSAWACVATCCYGRLRSIVGERGRVAPGRVGVRGLIARRPEKSAEHS